ncbi:hypothetical protein HAX54_011733 [Datura stramonium]|uniref:protein-serine/threonine phosphatase n=1 Tax=Datura stramonium TaxID=4076 RepID=A0ABS8RXW3_DATST|nr:hypothetical protein [Datura stramonium]
MTFFSGGENLALISETIDAISRKIEDTNCGDDPSNEEVQVMLFLIIWPVNLERVIAQSTPLVRHQKGLDVVLGQESAVLILDDTEVVWGKHRENVILMDRYHFFTSSCRQLGLKCKSLSELRSDENEAEGALASVSGCSCNVSTVYSSIRNVGTILLSEMLGR